MLQALGDVRYLSAAERCGGVVWKRGLLRKGYGLCHGAAGNGYTFLQLHRLTGQAHHWQRALQVCHQLPNISVATPPSIFSLQNGVHQLHNALRPHQTDPYPSLRVWQEWPSFTATFLPRPSWEQLFSPAWKYQSQNSLFPCHSYCLNTKCWNTH